MLQTRPEWLEAIFPWEQHSIVVNGRRMAYIDEGPRGGRPVLLLSGNPTWGFLYRDFFEPLTAAGYRAIAPDWVGAGYSDHPPNDSELTFAHHVADLVALIDQLDLRGFVTVGQDWGGPQGILAALQRVERFSAAVLMSTWIFTGTLSKFHRSPKPWTTWHAPLIGPYMMKRHKMLSHHGASALTVRGMTDGEARAYHHVYDEIESDAVVMTWPRTIPVREGDRGWQDMKALEARHDELAGIPIALMWAPEDPVFTMEALERMREVLPHAEEPILFDRARHFMQDDRGPDIAPAIVEFLDRRLSAKTADKTEGDA